MSDRVVVSGATGRMGLALAPILAADPAFELTGGIARVARDVETAQQLGYPTIESPESAAQLLGDADVLIDFSAPDQLERLLSVLPDGNPRVLVVGTTGIDSALAERLDAAAESRAVMVEANFSVGVQILTELARLVAERLPPNAYDAEIVEAHHRAKADAPSGTALKLAEAIASARGRRLDEVRRDGRTGRAGPRPEGEIGMHALRGGSVVGEHRILFLGARERLELAHAAVDRGVFAEGAVLAARWLSDKGPGRYRLKQVLDLEG